jgi:predicted protein tyrosine phosphatase
MIKAIYAVSRMAIAHPLHSDTNAKGSGRNILISINTYPDGLLITEPSHVERLKVLGYLDYLSLTFADITAQELFSFRMKGGMENMGIRLFSYDDARAIQAFIDKWKYEEIDRLVVHCDKGQSRSGAVALWAQRYCAQQGLSGFTEKQFWPANREISPNKYVGQVLCEVSGMKFDPYDF